MAQYNQVCEQAQERSKLTVPTLVRLIRVRGTEYLNAQGRFYKVSFLYEFQMNTLQDDIAKRQEEPRLIYSENELLRLVDHVLSALLILGHLKTHHSFIQPATIFIGDHYKINDVAF